MKRGGVVAGMCLVLVGCRAPWTVRSLQEVEAASTSTAPFDAGKFVDSIWASKVVPMAAQAEEFSDWQASGMGRAALVRGVGSVRRVDAAGELVALDLGGKASVALRVAGIHGTALRDALPFVQFSQFVNQVDFARASNALNERAMKTAAQAMGGGLAPGMRVQFAGVASPPADGGVPEVIPIVLTMEDAR